MNAGTFEAAPWGNCNLFSRRQTLLNRVWNFSEGITFKNSYEPGMKMRLIIFQLIHSSVKCVFDLISLLTGQIWLQMTFGCFMKKKNKKKKNTALRRWKSEAQNDIQKEQSTDFKSHSQTKLPTLTNLEDITLDRAKLRLDRYLCSGRGC